MNILYLTNHLNVGGITSYVLTLGRGLKLKGHNVSIASDGGAALGKFKEAGIDYAHIPIKTKSEISPRIFLSFFSLLFMSKKQPIDIIHSNSRTTQVLGCLLSKATGILHVSTCHGFFRKRISRKLFPCWGQKIIAISESVKEHLMRDFQVKEEKITMIYNGIDLGRFKTQDLGFKADIKERLNLGEGPIVGIVARLSDVKGHAYLIESMRVVIQRIPKAQLLIIGEGKMEKELLSLTRSLGIEKNVFFIPEVSDTKEMLSIMDVFVLPSINEGLGLALMEAMAAGLAVIGSDVGGIKSLIQDGKNGLLVKPADIQGLSQAILELLENTKKAKILGEAASNFINQNFSQEKMVLETEKLYLECLNASG